MLTRTLTFLLLTGCGGGTSTPRDPIDDDWAATSINDQTYPWSDASARDYQYGEKWLIIDSSLSGELFDYKEYLDDSGDGCERGYDKLDEEEVAAVAMAADTGEESDAAVYELTLYGSGQLLTCTVLDDLMDCLSDTGLYEAHFEAGNYSADASDLRGVDPCE